jgi:hypothetical protein
MRAVLSSGAAALLALAIGCSSAPPAPTGVDTSLMTSNDVAAAGGRPCKLPETVTLAREDLLAAMCRGSVCLFTHQEDDLFTQAIRSGQQDAMERAVKLREQRKADVTASCKRLGTPMTTGAATP